MHCLTITDNKIKYSLYRDRPPIETYVQYILPWFLKIRYLDITFFIQDCLWIIFLQACVPSVTRDATYDLKQRTTPPQMLHWIVVWVKYGLFRHTCVNELLANLTLLYFELFICFYFNIRKWLIFVITLSSLIMPSGKPKYAEN